MPGSGRLPLLGGYDVGGDLTVGLTLTAIGPFAATPAVVVHGLPPGVTASFAPSTISAANPTSTLTLTASSTAAVGVHPISVTTDSPLLGKNKTVAYQLTVDSLLPPPPTT